jgi:L-2-hydroxyglutarate oxidase
VLHSGIYYKPGSLRATNCRAGKQLMEAFCAEHGISFEICGKVIVAINESEVPALQRIFDRGQQNGVRCELIDAAQLKEIEPHAAGIKAIHVPEAGIVDYPAVCAKLAELIIAAGGEIRTNCRVVTSRVSEQEIALTTTAGDLVADFAVNCTGLYSDRTATAAGEKPTAKIVPFRGEYYELTPSAAHLCRNLIYPVPDPNFPFLGVHFTRMVTGGVECGPNAVLAFAREGYRRRDVNLYDLAETLSFPGFLKLAAKYWQTGLGEMWRSASKAAFLQSLQRLIPEVKRDDLIVGRSGVRAQAVGLDGAMVDDFVIQPQGRMIHILNAPSPAATSSLNIGKLVVERVGMG